MTLQQKLTSQADTSYVSIATSLAGAANTDVSNLTVATSYTFRYVAISGSGNTNGTAAAKTTLAQPGTPAVPTFSAVTATGMTVTAPALPTNTSSLNLQRKLTSQADTSYADVATGLAGAASTPLSGMVANTSYTFRCVAVSGGATTNGTAAAKATLSLPAAPAAPTFSAITGTSLTVTAPALPTNASSMTLQKKLGSEADAAYADYATTQAGASTKSVTGLASGTTYSFRYVAVSGTATVNGTSANATTLVLPGIPSAPTFGVIHARSVVVNAPALPANAVSLNLQRKLIGQADTSYGSTITGVTPSAPRTITNLTPSTGYTWRFQAVNTNGTTSGTGADATTLDAPANDNFANAQVLTGASGTITTNNVEASKETGEPNHVSTPYCSLWYKWTPTTSGQFSLSTLGSNFDTVLAVYTGTSLTALTKLAMNDEANGTSQSKLSFAGVAGTEYKVAIDGYGGAVGNVVFNYGPYVPAPDAATGFGATASNNAITLNWTATPRATNYTITRDAVGGSPYASFSVAAPLTTFTDSGLINGVSYVYSLTASNLEGQGLPAPQAGATPGTGFSAPIQRTPSGTINGANITPVISWYASPGAVSYKIYRRVSGSAWAVVGSPAGGATQWTDAALPTGPVYIYAISALNSAAVESALSNEKSIGSTTPYSVSNLVATPGNNTVYLTWDALPGATSYLVYRRFWVTPTSYSEGAPWTVYTNAFEDPFAANGSTFSYYVKAINPAGIGTPSYSSQVVPQAPASVPTGLSAVVFPNRIEISWAASTNVSTGYAYTVLRSSRPGGPYVRLDGTDNTTYPDTTARPGNTYYYVVRASNLTGDSVLSAELKVTMTPPSVTFSKVTSSGLTIHLPQLPYSATSYTLQRATEGTWTTNTPPSGMQAWFRADSLTTTENGAPVSAWSDLSGNGYMARTSRPERNPLLSNDVINGRPALRFDGVDDALNLSAGFNDFSAGLSVYSVFRRTPGDMNSVLQLVTDKAQYGGSLFQGIGLGGTNWGYYLNDSVNNGAVVGPNALPASQFLTAGVIQQGAAPGTNSGVENFVNGASTVTGTLAVPPTGVRRDSVIGNHPGVNNPFGGDMAEILIYNRALSSGERLSLDAYLARRYGLARAKPALTWTTIATNLSSASLYQDSGLSPNTTYWYRVVANSTPPVNSEEVDVTTLPSAPATPGTPTFSAVQTSSLTVNSSPIAWPSGASFLKLQVKLAAQPDTQFQDINSARQSGANVLPFLAKDLEPGTKYRFRFVALNDGAWTAGPSAEVTTASVTSGQGGGLLGTYFDSTNFSRPIFSRLDPTVDFNWTNYSPGANIKSDNFSIRWEGQIQPAFTENYVFHGSVDDVMRVWINGALILNSDSAPLDSNPIALVAGQKYNIQIDYHEWYGAAQAHFEWESPSQPRQIVPADRLYVPSGNGTGLRAQYFSGSDFDAQVRSRIDPQLAFGWPNDGPLPELQGKSFSVWWTGEVQPRFSETYNIRTISAGYTPTIWINGTKLTSGSIAMVGGQKYAIHIAYQAVSYFGKPELQLLWDSPSQPPQIIPSYRLFPAAADSTPNFTLSPDRALGISHNAPAVVVTGVPFTTTVTFRNNGTVTWTPATHRLNQKKAHLKPVTETELVIIGTNIYPANHIVGYRWVFENDAYIALPSNVAPGANVTFTIPVTMAGDVRDLNWTIDNYSGSPHYDNLSKDLSASVQTVAGYTGNLEVLGTTTNSVRLKLPSMPGYGTSFTLQRAVGTTATTVAAIPSSGRSMWFKAEDLHLPEGAPVLDWKDAASTGHAFQSEPGLAPVWTSTGPQGRPVVRFDGLDDRLATDINGPGGTEMTFFVVTKAASIRDYQPILFYRGANFFYYPIYQDGLPKMWLSSDGWDVGVDTGLKANEWNIGTVRWKSGTTNGYGTWRNGQPVVQRNSVVNTLPTENLTLGWDNGSAKSLHGDVAEILAYNRSLTDTERGSVELYLSHKYGAPLAPPGGVTWTNIATNLTGDQIYDDTVLTPNTVYYYRVVLQTSGAPLTGDSVQAATRPPLGAAPGVPGAPAAGVPLPSSITVTAPGPSLPANTDYLKLQVKMPNQPDDEYADIFGAVGPAEDKIAKGLTPETTYRFRFVAVGPGGVTPGTATADYTTTVPAPEVPGVPQFSAVTKTGLTVTMPVLPARATSLNLEYRESYGSAPFAQLPVGNVIPETPKADPASSGLNPEAVVVVTGLTSNTDYTFRAVAVGAGGTTAGMGGAVSTSDKAPVAPREPSFQNIGVTSVDVIAPPNLPDNSTSLTLQGRLITEDSTWVDVVTGIIPITPTYEDPPRLNFNTVSNLARAATYSFRYVAFGPGGSTAGPSADVTLQNPLVIWRPASPIECSGIRWPLAGASIQQGTRAKVQSFVGVDWDARDTYNGAGTVTDRYVDACTYVWTCDATCFANGGGFMNGTTRVATIKAQSPQFQAPSAGTYTLGLVVDDQGGLNVGNGEGGTRNDASKGFNDDPVKFSVSISVTP